MPDQTAQILVRFLKLPDSLKPVPIYLPEPIRPEWLAVTFVPSTPKSVAETYVLSFLDTDGDELEFLQFETLEIALDQARAIAGVEHFDWTECSTPIPNDWDRIRPTLFT
ncbi:MAG: hypothetical protein ACI8P0_000090 [Planctomycetaceae bacterium]|jgi:hypothetical protein